MTPFRYHGHLHRLGCSAFALMAGVSWAQAQTAAPTGQEEKAGGETPVLEEIVVRALQREQSLQDAPAVVTAFTERDIENIGVKSMRDFASLVPNLYLVETQSSTFAFVNIRGISQTRNTDPSVAVVIDGVLNTSSIGISQELFDVQQIEVLKGPQGALYGRNALGGAIVITTKQPGNEFEGFVRAGAGNGDMGKAQAAISGPLIKDELFGRLAMSYYNDTGFRKNITTGTKGDASQNLSLRSRILWEPGNRFSLDLRGTYSHDEANALGFIDVAPIFHETMPGSGVSLGQFLGIFKPGSPQAAAGPVVGGASVCLPGNCAELQVPGKPFNVGNFNNTQVPLQTNLLGIDHRNVYNLSALLKYEGDFGTITGVSSYDRLVQFAIGEQPPRTAAAAQKNTQFRVSDALSQEIRYTSPEDQWLRWTAGAYIVQTDTVLTTTVQRDKDGRDSLVDLVKRDPFAIAPGRCQGNPFPPGGPNDNQGNCVMGFLGDDSNNLAYAFFAQLSLDLTEKLELIVSGRYDRDERRQKVITPDEFIAFGDLRFGDKRKANFDDFQPKATLKWTPNANLMTYFTYAEGFRSGGFNQPGIQALADANRPSNPLGIPNGIFDVFPEQTTRGVEGGFKWTSPDRRLTANVAGFYTKVTNMQTFTAITINTILSQVVIPVDKTRLFGVDFDASYLITPDLQVSVGFGATDSKITRDRSSNGAFEGNEAPTTPRTTTNIGLQYQRDVSVGSVDGSFFLRADYRRIGKIYSVAGNFSQRNPVNLLDLRGGFETASRWRIEGFAKNATNNNYFHEMFNPAGFGFPAPLRHWGFEVTKKF